MQWFQAVPTNTILHNHKEHFFFFLKWFFKQVVIRYGVDIRKGEMLGTESKRHCNRQLGVSVFWFLECTGLLFTSS